MPAEAAASAEEATAAATEATAAAGEATGAAAEASLSATGAGVSALAAAASALAAGGSASSASSSASDASDSADNASSSATEAQNYLNTLLTTGITLQGDISGSGVLSSPITTSFIPNPVFHGNGSMTMPFGNTTQRPSALTPGMIRFNTSL